ncbi:MAG: Dephospho-CoA kinase [Firmicutes bacterium]|nr:Dephospho-CoA kinase [Bacillota bacterium]
MYIIGLTGGIASGKSTVSAMLAELGAYIIDADEIAHIVVMPNQPAWHDIVAHFGSGILLPNGAINRKILGEKIFKDKVERLCLEKITHHYIEDQVQKKITHAKLIGTNIVVLDVPLLIETDWHKMVNEIWVVYVKEEVQLSRLIDRNKLTYEQARDRINAQMSLAEKVKLADVVIDNNLDIEHARKQVTAAWGRLSHGSTCLHVVTVTE